MVRGDGGDLVDHVPDGTLSCFSCVPPEVGDARHPLGGKASWLLMAVTVGATTSWARVGPAESRSRRSVRAGRANSGKQSTYRKAKRTPLGSGVRLVIRSSVNCDRLHERVVVLCCRCGWSKVAAVRCLRWSILASPTITVAGFGDLDSCPAERHREFVDVQGLCATLIA